ncbi:AAA family ATPase [Candidatus Raskinella chloraquaticus]
MNPAHAQMAHDAMLDEPGAATGPARVRRGIRPIPRITVQAFCETHELQSAIETAREDRRLARVHIKVQAGGLPAAVEFYRDAPTPNLVILETTERREGLLRDLQAFSDVCDPTTRVAIVGHVNDILLYRELTQLGIADYAVVPIAPLDVIEIISDIYADPAAKPIGRNIAFVGAKGGVGASTLAHNVAERLANTMKIDTIIADLDLPFGTANLNFNQDPAQGVADAVLAPDRLDATMLDRLLSNCSPHLHLLAAPSTLDRTYDFAEGSFEQLVDLVRVSAPVTILDMPHGWNGWIRRTLIACDEIILVCAPELSNLRNAKNMVDLLRQARPHDPAPKLVLNQVGMPKRPEIKPNDFARALDLPLAASVPFDANLFGLAANNGQMIAEVQKTSKASDAIRVIAELIEPRSLAGKGRNRLGNLSLPLVGQIQALLAGRKKA